MPSSWHRGLRAAPAWLAPEQLVGSNYSGEKLDVWSFGIILHFFLAGYNPFESYGTVQESLENIKNADLSNLATSLSPDARDLISKCLSRDFNERPSWEEISRVSARLPCAVCS